jgi:hypothetical protein
MPRLYCAECGKQEHAKSVQNRERYQQEGETVLIVTGKLISGPWMCDRCNGGIAVGKQAFLVRAFPKWMIEELHVYDYVYEREYFATEEIEVMTYGVDWPGISSGS